METGLESKFSVKLHCCQLEKAKYVKGNMKEEFVLQPLDFSAKFLM